MMWQWITSAVFDPPSINVRLLRDSAPLNQATHLQDVISKRPAELSAITSELISHVAADDLPPITLSIWMSVCKDPHAIITILCQPHNVIAQQYAITHLRKNLRDGRTFAKMWEAGGGATGFAEIASNLSIRNLRNLCTAFGNTSDAPGAPTSPRGLWQDDFLSQAKGLIYHRLEFSLQILDKFAKDENLFTRITSDKFLARIILPLAKRYSSKKGVALEKHDQFWHLIAQCLSKQQDLRAPYPGCQARLIFYCAKAWGYSTKRLTLAESFKILINSFSNGVIQDCGLDSLLYGIAPSLRYQTLRLFLQYAPGYGFDIDAVNTIDKTVTTVMSQETVFPASLFFSLPTRDALPLFERLYSTHPNFMFPRTSTQFPKCQLYQRYQLEGNKISDCELVRALLIHRIKDKGVLQMYKKGALNDLHLSELPMRMKATADADEGSTKGDWAVAALSLCVALRDLDLYAETLRWARRFNENQLAVERIYNQASLVTKEGIGLVAAMPLKPALEECCTDEIKDGIQKGNRILLLFLETAAMASREPIFNPWHWRPVSTLVWEVVKARLMSVDAFQDRHCLSHDEVFEIIWKPTIDTLLAMESLRSQRFKVPGHGDYLFKIFLAPLENHKEVKEAVGDYVDDWHAALKMYLRQSDGRNNNMTRFRKAWKHATTHLRKEGMSTEETTWFWAHHFKRAGVGELELDVDELKHLTIEPLFPVIEDNSRPAGWMSELRFRHVVSSSRHGKDNMTCLDAMLESKIRQNTSNYLRISIQRSQKLTTTTAGAVATAAFLALKSEYGLMPHSSTAFFPNTEVGRIPALHLD
ncbi:hypothetical protein PT974_09611 [Cladobotryum mycophilum]|uniref:Uncharacterized protein n=1 Tax=Cladobotryum mycophilum TaxID=491253 RepID=A0ABR0SGS0_9HYPO